MVLGYAPWTWLSALCPSRIGGLAVIVQRVVTSGLEAESWTVLEEDGGLVGPIERFLAYLSDIGRSPNTVRAYAYDLKDYFWFLQRRELDWRKVRLEDIGEFVRWLRQPPAGRDGLVAVLPVTSAYVGPATLNRKLASLAAFYQHAARRGVDVGPLLAVWQPGWRARGSWKPFLYHVSKELPQPGRAIAFRVPAKVPRVLAPHEVQAILDACTRLRDRFLVAVLHETGMRIGEALGLRHADIEPAERQIRVCHRINANGARSKSRDDRVIPATGGLVRLYADYLNDEYGQLDSDYVFVNLWAEPMGHAMGYPAAYDLMVRLRRRTGIDFHPHLFRHTMATRQMSSGVPVEVVSKLLGHSSVTTTVSVYGHLTAADARRALEAAGWLSDGGVRL